MKNYFLLICCFLSLTQIVTGQLENRRFSFQAKAPMFNWISTNSNSVNGAGVNLGYGFAGSIEFGMNNNVYLTAGFGFAGNMGGNLRYEQGGNIWPQARLTNSEWNTGSKPLPNDVRLRYRVNMIEVPISLKLYTSYNGSTRYYLELPIVSLGVLTSSRGDIRAPGIETKDEIIREETRWMHINLGAGAGLSYDIGFAEFFAGLQYNYAITNLSRNNGHFAIETTPGDFILLDDTTRLNMHGVSLKFGLLF